jgi:DNA-binding NtrC family response regulator
MIAIDDLPHAVKGAEASKTIEVEVGATIDEVEKRVILQTLVYTRGDRSRAAQILGIGRKTLYRKLQLYNHAESSE